MQYVDTKSALNYTFTVLKDILAVNPGIYHVSCICSELGTFLALKIHVTPWSPVRHYYFQCNKCISLVLSQPAWMKTTGSMNGGTLKPELIDICRFQFVDLKGLTHWHV